MATVLSILDTTYARFFGVNNFTNWPNSIDMSTLLILSLSSLNGSPIPSQLDHELVNLINNNRKVAREVYSLHQTSCQQARFWARIQPNRVKKMLGITTTLLPTNEHELRVYLMMMSQVSDEVALVIHLMLDMRAMNHGPFYQWLDRQTHIFDGITTTVQHAIRANLKCEMINNCRPAPQQPGSPECIVFCDPDWGVHWNTLADPRGFLARIIGFPLIKWMASRIGFGELTRMIVHKDCLIQKSFCLDMNQVQFQLIATIIHHQTTLADRAQFWSLISKCPDKNLDWFIHNCLRCSIHLGPQNLKEVECYLQALVRVKQNG